MKKTASFQYTIRGVSPALDRVLRERARKEGSSLNETALILLEKAVGLSDAPVRYDDLDDLSGTWVEDEAFDRAVETFRRIDQDLWK